MRSFVPIFATRCSPVLTTMGATILDHGGGNVCKWKYLMKTQLVNLCNSKHQKCTFPKLGRKQSQKWSGFFCCPLLNALHVIRAGMTVWGGRGASITTPTDLSNRSAVWSSLRRDQLHLSARAQLLILKL